MERNYLLDNAKILLMFLVVFGHCLELVNNSPLLKTLYLIIYSFHIPMFVLISGMLSKSHSTQQDLTKHVASLLIPLLIFEVLYELVELARYATLSHYTLNLQPYWLLWFLWSLFFWKLLLPVVYCFRFPVIISIMIAVVAGYCPDTGYYLGLSRTLSFFPFFVLGHTLSPVFFQRLQNNHRSLFFSIVLLAFILFWYCNPLSVEWFYGSRSYAALGFNEWYAGFIRLLIYGISFLFGISIIALLPNRVLAITAYGERSLYIYIWHGFIIKIISALHLINNLEPLSAFIVLLLLSVIITRILAIQLIATLTDKLLFIPVRKILLKTEF